MLAELSSSHDFNSRLTTMASLFQELHNRQITLAACPGRILLVKQQVSLQFALPRQTLGRLHVARVPCWYSTPSLSGWSRACVSNLTSSWLIAFTGQSRSRRRTHVTALQMRLSNDGGSVPFFLRRLSKRGWRYLVLRCLRLLLRARRLERARVMCLPRCLSSAAHTTWPLVSLITASPVV